MAESMKNRQCLSEQISPRHPARSIGVFLKQSIRWILALPAAVLAATGFCIGVEWTVEDVVNPVLSRIVDKFPAGAMLVVVTAIMVPRFRKTSAIISLGLMLFFSGLTCFAGWTYGGMWGNAGWSSYVEAGAFLCGGCIAFWVDETVGI